MEIKGSLVIDYVKAIRTFKDKDWDKWLEAEDWELINGQVLPSAWYPYESVRRIGYAVFKEVAGSNLNATRTLGKVSMKNLLKIYGNIVVPDDPQASIDKLMILRNNFMRGDTDIKVTERDEGWMKFSAIRPSQEKDPERSEAYCYQLAGQLEELVEQTGGKNPKAKVQVTDQGADLLINWE